MKKAITTQVRIKADAKDIVDALIASDKLKLWWGVTSSFIEQRDGGLYTLTWLHSKMGIKFITTGRINLYNKRSHLYLEDVLYLNYERPILGPFKIKFDVESKSSYSILTVVQSGYKKGKHWDWYYEKSLEGWGEALFLLKKYLEKL